MASSDSAKRLVDQIVEEYENCSPLRNEFDCRVFEGKPTGDYTVLSAGLTSDSELLSPDIEFFGNFPRSVADNISTWERNHILSEIEQSDTPSITIDEVTENALFEVHKIVDQPTNIYLPMTEEYYKEFLMNQKGMLSDDLEVEWLSSDIDDFDVGFVVAANRIQLSQYTQLPSTERMKLDNVISEYSSYSAGAPIFIEFCRTNNPSEIEFHYGTVLEEEPRFSYNSVGVIQLPDLG